MFVYKTLPISKLILLSDEPLPEYNYSDSCDSDVWFIGITNINAETYNIIQKADAVICTSSIFSVILDSFNNSFNISLKK